MFTCSSWGGGGAKKSYSSSLRGVQKVPNVPFPHLSCFEFSIHLSI